MSTKNGMPERARIMRLLENTNGQCNKCLLKKGCGAILQTDKEGFSEQRYSEVASLSCPICFITRDECILGCYQEGDMVSTQRLRQRGIKIPSHVETKYLDEWHWIVDTNNDILAVANMGIRKYTGIKLSGWEELDHGEIRVTAIIPKNMVETTNNLVVTLKELGKEIDGRQQL